MLDLADRDGDDVALDGDDRNVLFGCGIDGIGNELGHGLAAAAEWSAGVDVLRVDVAALVATEELDIDHDDSLSLGKS